MPEYVLEIECHIEGTADVIGAETRLAVAGAYQICAFLDALISVVPAFGCDITFSGTASVYVKVDFGSYGDFGSHKAFDSGRSISADNKIRAIGALVGHTVSGRDVPGLSDYSGRTMVEFRYFITV